MFIRTIVERAYSLKSTISVIVLGITFALNVPSDEQKPFKRFWLDLKCQAAELALGPR